MATNHTYKKIKVDGYDVQAESAIRDGNGSVIPETYIKNSTLPSTTVAAGIKLSAAGQVNASGQLVNKYTITVSGSTLTVAENY